LLARLLPYLYVPISIAFLADAVLSGGAYLLRDVVTFFHPWQDAVADAIRGGHLPLWNHDSFCGVPLLANLQSGVFYPVNWLYWVLPFDAALTTGMFLHLTLAALLMRAFLLRVGLARLGSFLGGTLFAYGTWSLSHLEFPMQLGAAVWLPMAWTGIWMVMREGNLRGCAVGALAIALSLLSGYPQMTLFGLMSSSVLALMLTPRALRQEGRAKFRVLAWPAILVLAGLVAAVQILPSREMTALSQKAAPYTAEVALSRSLPVQGLAGLLDPFFLGLPGVDRFWGGEVAEYAFATFYIGAAGLVWLIAAGRTFRRPLRRKRIRYDENSREVVCPTVIPWFLAAGGIIGVLLALGRHTPLYPLLHAHVPGFGQIRWPAAATYLIAAHLAPLAAIGFRSVTRDRDRIRRASLACLVLGGLTLAVWALAQGPGSSWFRLLQTAGAPEWQGSAYEAGQAEWLGASLGRGAVLVAIGAIGLLLFDIRSRVAGAWMVLILADLFLTARWFDTPVARGFYDETPANVAALAEELGEHRVFVPGSTSQLGNFLYGSRDPDAYRWARSSLLCNANMPLGIAAASGCEPLAPRRHEAFAQAFDAPSTPWAIKERIFDLWDAGLYFAAPEVRPLDVPRMSPETLGLEISRHEPRLGRAGVLSNWRTVEAGPPVLQALFAPSHDPAVTTLLEDTPGAGVPPSPSRKSPQRADALAVEAGPNSLRVAWQIGPAGMLRVLESWDPGWQAWVNGEPVPVYRADFLFMAVPVPQGPCEVHFRYRPSSLRQGAGASLIGLVGCLALGLLGRRRDSVTSA
jgi:hypothetical protein